MHIKQNEKSMKKILPLIALIASCVTNPIQKQESQADIKNSIEKIAEETCSRMPEKELATIAYFLVTKPENKVMVDEQEGCIDYEKKFENEGVTYLVATRTGASANCYAKNKGILPLGIKTGLLFTEALPFDILGSSVYAFRLYRDIIQREVRAEDFINTQGITFLCTNNCKTITSKFDSYLKSICKANKIENMRETFKNRLILR